MNELGIAPATLYRWCGDRERLLNEVMWSITEDCFELWEQNAPEDLRGPCHRRQPPGYACPDGG